MGVNRTEQTLSSRKATNSRVAPLRGATLGGWLLLLEFLFCDALISAVIIVSGRICCDHCVKSNHDDLMLYFNSMMNISHYLKFCEIVYVPKN